jgi:acetyltransferase-like isoleucine patch superfamily enzyme
MAKLNYILYSFLLYLQNRWISYFPIHWLRNSITRLFLKNCGQGNQFLMGLEMRNPQQISIGNHNIINSRVMLDGRKGKLTIGNNVNISTEAQIWTLEHDAHDPLFRDKGGDVVIEDYAWIGSRAMILPGVTIGRGAVVAAGSIVRKDVAPMSIVAGMPAKEIGTRKAEPVFQNRHTTWFQ